LRVSKIESAELSILDEKNKYNGIKKFFIGYWHTLKDVLISSFAMILVIICSYPQSSLAIDGFISSTLYLSGLFVFFISTLILMALKSSGSNFKALERFILNISEFTLGLYTSIVLALIFRDVILEFKFDSVVLPIILILLASLFLYVSTSKLEDVDKFKAIDDRMENYFGVTGNQTAFLLTVVAIICVIVSFFYWRLI
jgi:hypothetical protein